jgi:hypothetical protein
MMLLTKHMYSAAFEISPPTRAETMNYVIRITVFGPFLALSSYTTTKVGYVDCPYIGVMSFHCANYEPGVIGNKQ